MLDGEQVAVQTDGLATRFLAFSPSGPEGAVVGKRPLDCRAELSIESLPLSRRLCLQRQRQTLLEDPFVDARCWPTRVVADDDDTLPSAIGQSGRRLRLKSSNSQPCVVALNSDVEIDAGQPLEVRLALNETLVARQLETPGVDVFVLLQHVVQQLAQ